MMIMDIDVTIFHNKQRIEFLPSASSEPEVLGVFLCHSSWEASEVGAATDADTEA